MGHDGFRLPPELRRDSGLRAAALDIRRALAVVRVAMRIAGPPRWLVPRSRRRSHPTRAERVREGFEQLGLAYLKLGQFLAMRYDLIPRDICDELSRLFDQVEPAPLERALALIESEFGVPADELFSHFGSEPVASASVAQVHEATTVDGRRVAVKIQRPGIERTFAADMRNLGRLARIADRLSLLGHMSAREVAREFIAWTTGELDFLSEARTAERLRREALPFEVVPEMHWELISRRVLTMEFVEGVSLNDVTKLIAEGGEELLDRTLPGIDMKLVAHRVVNASMRQLFASGFFHGDPHPGNILVRADSTVVFVDFGIFGELSRYHRALMVRMVESLAVGDVDRAFNAYAATADATDGTNAVAFETDVKQVLKRWYVSSTGGGDADDRHLGKYISEILDLSRRHAVRMNWDLALFWRTMHALDTTALKLPQYFDTLAEMRAFFARTFGNPLTRSLELAFDPAWQIDVIEAGNRLGGFAPRLRPPDEAHSPWRPDTAENRHVRRRRDGAAKAVTAAGLALSSGLLAVSAAVAPAVQLLAAVSAPLLLLTAVRQAH
jgi:ubiquinone biosynthesis protein